VADRPLGVFVVAQFRDLAREEVGDVVNVAVIVGFGTLLVASVVAAIAAGRILAPVRLVTETARTISETDLSRRIPAPGTDDEIATLAATFNGMLERLEHAFATQRNFVDDAGHELRTPITIIRGHPELLGDDPQDRRETVALVTDELDRMNRMVDDLLVLARLQRPDFLDLEATGGPHAMSRILIAEDEPRIASFLEKGLRANGFTTSVAEDGVQAVIRARSGDFDLLILDIGLPGKDGFSVLRELRGAGFPLPIIVLTARDGVADTVAGLEGGADDYVTKPFRFEELLARVRVRLRGERATEETVLRVGRLALDLRTRRLEVDGRSLELTAREFTLAETFLRTPGRCCRVSSSSATSGDTTTIPVPTSSMSTSATSARSWGPTGSPR
jgi:DNA-binding response OmpR family regulator/HAMP domain-containing protein